MKTKGKPNKPNKNEKKGIAAGIIAGLVPHIGCISFAVFTLLGVTFMSSLFKKFLLLKWAFPFMILLSFFLAGISSFFYLRKNCCANKSRYIIMVFSSVLLINFLFYFIIFPLTANISAKSTKNIEETKLIFLQVKIPCPGHAPLIIDELKKMPEVISVNYRAPNYFDVECDRGLDEQKLLNLGIFREFPCKIIK